MGMIVGCTIKEYKERQQKQEIVKCNVVSLIQFKDAKVSIPQVSSNKNDIKIVVGESEYIKKQKELAMKTEREVQARELERNIQEIKNNIARIEIEEKIIQVFGEYGKQAIAVVDCESGFDPDAFNMSGAKGLFQLMPVHEWRANGNSLFDVDTNIDVAYQIYSEKDEYGNSQGWNPWKGCRP